MPTTFDRTFGNSVQPDHITQLFDAWEGVAAAGVPASLTTVNDNSSYALRVKNQGTAGALLVEDSAANDLLRVNDNGTLIALGTITTDLNVLNSTVTWNASGVTFTAWELNVTDTASATASLLLDLQVAGSSKFSISKAGAPTFAGTAYIGDTANAKVTLGLTINQAAADDEILSLKSSDVAHGVTDVTETDTYGRFLKAEATGGGLRLDGLSDADVSAGFGLILRGISGIAANTAKATTARGIVEIDAAIKSGTGVTVAGADGNLVVIQSSGTTRYIFDVEGSAHADVEWVAFDDFNDSALLDSVEHALLPGLQRDPIQDSFGRVVRYSRDQLETAGIIGRGSYRETGDGKARAMLNMTKLTMALAGAMRQQYDRIAALERRVGLNAQLIDGYRAKRGRAGEVT